MSILTRIIARLAKLPPAVTYDIVKEKDIPIPMDDGVILLTDRYYPNGSHQLPTVLIRSPYGRDVGNVLGNVFAERNFQVVVQSTRGTFGSGGKFNPFVDEKRDGLATIEWMKKQSWYNGKVAMFGPSYLGYVQWAIAEAAGDDLSALGIQVSVSDFFEHTYPNGTMALETMFSWANMMQLQEKTFAQIRSMFEQRRLKQIFNHLPLNQADTTARGYHIDFFQDWLENTSHASDYWQSRNHAKTVKEVTTPIHFTTGWYDIFLPWNLDDYVALREAGQRPYLTIGAWQHRSLPLMGTALRETIAFFNAYMHDDESALPEKYVRLYITGADEWREYDDYPIEGTQPQPYYLQPNGILAQTLPPESEPDTYVYDPASPTPAVAGASLFGDSFPKDNRVIESRPDVLIYTSEPLSQNIDVIGTITVELCVKSSVEYTDFFVRLCDVHENGKSINVTDMIQRITPDFPSVEADGTRHINLDLYPIAHQFKQGHRLRLQVSSAAHPRFARNTNSGEPLGTATQLIPATQSVYHDPQHASCFSLPVVR